MLVLVNIKLVSSNSTHEYEGSSVILVGDEGLIEILPDHSDVLLRLNVSMVKIKTAESEPLLYFVNGGLVEVKSGKVKITSPLIVLIKNKSEAMEYYKTFKEKSLQMRQMTEKAVNSRNFYESETAEEFYLFEEERLAKFEIFNEIIKGR